MATAASPDTAVRAERLTARLARLDHVVMMRVFLGAFFIAVFWLIGAAAGAIWWARGIEARGLSLETLAAQPS